MYKYKSRFKKRKKSTWILLTLSLIAIALGGIYYFLDHYRVENVYVDGNVHYTKEEIMDIVMDGPLGKNTLYLSMRYKNKSITDVPFVAAMDVNVASADTIRIVVYEKSLAGYIEYLGRYIYFDKDGRVVESSTMRTLGIPQVHGLEFDHVVVGELLPVQNSEVFSQVLGVTQTLDKGENSLHADHIYFNKSHEMTLYFGDIKVLFGKYENLDEKINLLKTFIPDLEGKKGTLNVENYSPGKKNYSFTPEE
ncbi:MAG: cell division protein FtsQ [Lachnospiraceae bacterium]|nr:cell division protein FtsQ [Lachnospiraceae bacterium]